MDLETLAEVENELNDQKAKNDELVNEKVALHERYDNLLKDMTEYRDAERMAKIKTDVEIHEVRTENQNLQTYVEGLGQQLSFNNSG